MLQTVEAAQTTKTPFAATARRRSTDQLILTDWIGEGARVLDLGCGRGVLLEHLRQVKGVSGVGVDPDPAKVLGCVRRGVPAYQGDAEALMREMPDRSFDWVVCSRTVQELARPAAVLEEALRVGKRLAVGFVNFGYWRNRIALLRTGARVRNEVYPHPWEKSAPQNPVSLSGFEEFCTRRGITIHRRVCLRGDWNTPCARWPNLRAGYALYELSRPPKAQPPGE